MYLAVYLCSSRIITSVQTGADLAKLRADRIGRRIIAEVLANQTSDQIGAQLNEAIRTIVTVRTRTGGRRAQTNGPLFRRRANV